MKKICKTQVLLTLMTMLVTVLAANFRLVVNAAEGDVGINKTNFPDDTFRTYVSSNCDTDKNGVLSADEIATVTKIDVSESAISSLEGIEYFSALEELDCTQNNLEKLDVSKNTALRILSCYYNQLTSLDVSKNTDLFSLNFFANDLTSLDVSKNIALYHLGCAANNLTSLDVSKNTALEHLDCRANLLTVLDVSKNTELASLDCSDNRLINLDVSKNTALKTLYCRDNQLSSLDLSKNINLQNLENAGQWRQVRVGDNGLFDLSTLSGFDLSKVTSWLRGAIDGNYLRFSDGYASYYYDCGNDKFGKSGELGFNICDTCVFDKKIVTDEALVIPAGCDYDAVYYKSCACGAISDEDMFTAANTALGHDYAAAWSWDATSHWHECSRCEDRKGEAVHRLKTSVTPATLKKAGKTVTSCRVCKQVTDAETIDYIKKVALAQTAYAYDGKTKNPKLIVKDSAGKTISSKYYTLRKPKGRKTIGKYTYKITFKGNYKGTKSLTFTINPKGTTIVSVEAEPRGFTVQWKLQDTQTTGYEIRYATNPKMDKAKIVKITKNSETSRKITELAAKKEYYVQVRTYTQIGLKTYYSDWSKTKTIITGR